MSDTGRKDFTEKAQEKMTPESEKSVLDKAKEGVTDTGDKLAGNLEPSGEKSIGQKALDATGSNPGEESYIDTAKKTVGEAVEYVEKTATDVYNKVVDATK